uniref:G-protein coupled receptors family 1 profile domain-containing protein n=1 Tax=Chaetoceros debilis TaxID=122233 RepID=A0A7S3V6X0_9STRA
MLIMSISDVIGSTAMALTTLPMPSDVHEVYPFVGKALGNSKTCIAQGALILLGSGMASVMNCVLCLYYVLTIRYGMNPVAFKRRILPLSFLVFGGIICMLLYFLAKERAFIPLSHEPYCLVGMKYPVGCEEDGAEEGDEDYIKCIHSSHSGGQRIFNYTGLALFGINAFVILVSLILVIASVYETEKANRTRLDENDEEIEVPATTVAQQASIDIEIQRNGIDNSNSGNLENEEERIEPFRERSSEETKVALRQALMYITTYFLTWTWYAITIALGGKGPDNVYRVIDPLKVFFMPLQGFFNACIFLYHQILSLRQSESGRELQFLQAIKMVIMTPKEVPEVLLSMLEIVDFDRDETTHATEEQKTRDLKVVENSEDSFARLSYLGENGHIGPASLPSSFASIDTPSLDLSNALMEDEQDEVVLDMHKSSDAGKNAHRAFYTFCNRSNDEEAIEDGEDRIGYEFYSPHPLSTPNLSSDKFEENDDMLSQSSYTTLRRYNSLSIVVEEDANDISDESSKNHSG